MDQPFENDGLDEAAEAIPAPSAARSACTQALWEAVMRKNPSRFQGKDRPVERVSWDEVQKFLARLEERVPGL